VDISFINCDTTYIALEQLRQKRLEEDHALLGLEQIALWLESRGMDPGAPALRELALQSTLHEVICERLALHRGDGQQAVGPAGLTPTQERERLAQDFQEDADRQAWSYLYYRYVSTWKRTVYQLAMEAGSTDSTMRRRKCLGLELLVEALRLKEQEVREPISFSPPAAPTVFEDILADLRDPERKVRIPPDQAAEIARHPVATLDMYRVSRIAEWSQPHYWLDDRFVDLSLLIDQGEDNLAGRWASHVARFLSLGQVMENMPDTALAVLGPPGSGKSTLLRRFEIDAAIAAIRGESAVTTFFIELSRYQATGANTWPAPRAWLNERWVARYPRLPSLDALLADGQVVLLLDALNEMPAADHAARREAVRLWKGFIQEVAQELPGNRVMFSCRSLDYSAPLSTPELRVPQVLLEPLDDAGVRRFLQAYIPTTWQSLWETLEGTPQLDLLRLPYFLKLLVEQVGTEPHTPQGLAGLFTGFVRHALHREVARGNPLFGPDTLLTSRDCRQVTYRNWKSIWDLPARGLLIPSLAQLAHSMQEQHVHGETAQVRIDCADACRLVGGERAEDVIAAGCALGVIDEDTATDEVLFRHQLLQEYFAARRLAEAPTTDLVRADWLVDTVEPSLETVMEGLAPADPLPPLPSTGWEETMVLAAAMTDDPDHFIRDVQAVNLVLAGRCAAYPEVAGRVSDGLKNELRWALVHRSRDPSADLRARIAAGLALGALGDPRFERRAGPHGDYLMPPLVDIPGGVYVIGEDSPMVWEGERWDDHTPSHTVTLAPFSIGQFPVTNAEWACFIAAGGYEDDRWWDTEAARAWQRGERRAESKHAEVRYWVEVFRAKPDLLEAELASGSLTQDEHARWKLRLGMNPDQLREHLDELYPDYRETEPPYWQRPQSSNPAQPVVGICWYEARAYCAWLAAQTGMAFRLPTEVEWEAAARGAEGRCYPYGNDFDPAGGNTLESHVRGSSPVGVFVAGDTSDGIADLSGNCYEWTSSAWGGETEDVSYNYPYKADDGREDPLLPASVPRVLRGGAWCDGAVFARATCRCTHRPDFRSYAEGMRLAVSR